MEDFDDSNFGDTEDRCEECGSSDIEYPDDRLSGVIYYSCHACGFIDMG